MSLVITYAPRNDEDGFGYYRRLAADNAFFGWQNLADTADVECNRRSLLMRADVVAPNLGLEHSWAESAKQKEVICQSWKSSHRAHSDAVCPKCLAHAPYLRHHWAHTHVTACATHRIQLIDRCNACGDILTSKRTHVGMCSCGHNLTCLPHLPATISQQWLSALIASNGKDSGGLSPGLHGVDVSVLVRGIRILCQDSDPVQPKLPRIAALPKTVAEAIEFLAPLEALLADWPVGFRTHVEERIAAGRKNARTLNTLLGDWYISLRKLSAGTALEQFVHVIIEVAAQKSDCVLGLDSTKALAEATTNYMHSSHAAKAIGISVSRLHDAILAGECAYRTKRTGTRGQIYEIPNLEVDRIQKQRAEWVSDLAACRLADVSPVVLERMKAAGVIRSDIHWRADLMKGGPVNQQSIQDLYAQVSQWTDPVRKTDDVTLTWAELTSRRMGEKQAIESLMKAIVKGDVRATGIAKTLGEFSFQRSDVSQYFGAPLLEAGMSLQQLAKATNWKWESISNWVHEGLLGSELIHRRGQPCRIVLPHQLLAFRQIYIPLADLARAMGTKASALSRLLPGIRLIGAKQLPNGVMRGGLIRIADLGQLALLGARAGEDLFVPAE